MLPGIGLSNTSPATITTSTFSVCAAANSSSSSFPVSSNLSSPASVLPTCQSAVCSNLMLSVYCRFRRLHLLTYHSQRLHHLFCHSRICGNPSLALLVGPRLCGNDAEVIWPGSLYTLTNRPAYSRD